MPWPDVRVVCGDCLEAIPRLVAEGLAANAVVTDPPYHLTTAGRFSKVSPGDGTDAGRRAAARSDASARLSVGFMGKAWDGGDVAFRPETWATITSALRPGGFLLAFGGTRTFHRVACAIEDAGLVLQDTLCWLYGSGFPKRRDALKPAWEPIVLAYRPGGKRTLQVDECRIGDAGGMGKVLVQLDDRQADGWGTRKFVADDTVRGRYPANVCHDGGCEVECTLGDASRFFYSAKADADDRWHSRHPTVKPLDLMRWLVALVCPPGGLVLDPFAGSGTTGGAALLSGRRAVLVEREEEYVMDIRSRLDAVRSRAPAATRTRRAQARGSDDLLAALGIAEGG